MKERVVISEHLCLYAMKNIVNSREPLRTKSTKVELFFVEIPFGMTLVILPFLVNKELQHHTWRLLDSWMR